MTFSSSLDVKEEKWKLWVHSNSTERQRSTGLLGRSDGPCDQCQVCFTWPGRVFEWGGQRQTYLQSLCLLGVQYPKRLISQTLLLPCDLRAVQILEQQGSEVKNFLLWIILYSDLLPAPFLAHINFKYPTHLNRFFNCYCIIVLFLKSIFRGTALPLS